MKTIRHYDNVVPSGSVINSKPGNGSRAVRGSAITLTVSLGKPKVPMISPGTPVEEAERLIREAHLRPHRDESASRYHPSHPVGTVLEVSPSSGSTAPIDSPVRIVTSKGPPPEVQVPNVIGKKLNSARKQLETAGFHIEVNQIFGGENGRVVSQSPVPFISTRPGSTVTLTVFP